jgi:type VI secretion system secreted protein Hcp
VAGHMFLDIEGVKGESKDKDFKDKIDILSWTWGATNSGTFHKGSGGGSGKANVREITITKSIDASSADLQLACLSGKHFGKGKLIVLKAAGAKTLEYLNYELTDLMITAVNAGCAAGEEQVTESVSINFAKVHFSYKIQDEKGAGKDGGQYTWNVAENSKG